MNLYVGNNCHLLVAFFPSQDVTIDDGSSVPQCCHNIGAAVLKCLWVLPSIPGVHGNVTTAWGPGGSSLVKHQPNVPAFRQVAYWKCPVWRSCPQSISSLVGRWHGQWQNIHIPDWRATPVFIRDMFLWNVFFMWADLSIKFQRKPPWDELMIH